MCITVNNDVPAAVKYFERAIKAEMDYYQEREADAQGYGLEDHHETLQ
jgi:hypothetical protein